MNKPKTLHIHTSVVWILNYNTVNMVFIPTKQQRVSMQTLALG